MGEACSMHERYQKSEQNAGPESRRDLRKEYVCELDSFG